MRPFVVLLWNHSWQKAVCSGAASHAHTDARTGPDPKPIFQNLILQTTGQLPAPPSFADYGAPNSAYSFSFAVR